MGTEDASATLMRAVWGVLNAGDADAADDYYIVVLRWPSGLTEIGR